MRAKKKPRSTKRTPEDVRIKSVQVPADVHAEIAEISRSIGLKIGAAYQQAVSLWVAQQKAGGL